MYLGTLQKVKPQGTTALHITGEFQTVVAAFEAAEAVERRREMHLTHLMDKCEEFKRFSNMTILKETGRGQPNIGPQRWWLIKRCVLTQTVHAATDISVQSCADELRSKQGRV